MRTLSLAALAAIAAAPVMAAGPTEPAPAPVVQPAPAPVYSPSSGDWGGFYVGGQLGYADIRDDADGDGNTYGLHAGYNWDLGNWVLGTELEYDWADIDVGDAGDSIDSITRLKLRGGYDLGRTLLYATAGAAHADADVGGASLSDTGYFFGAGVGYQLTDQWTLGGEIMSHEFDDFDNSGLDIGATTAAVRASFRF